MSAATPELGSPPWHQVIDVASIVLEFAPDVADLATCRAVCTGWALAVRQALCFTATNGRVLSPDSARRSGLCAPSRPPTTTSHVVGSVEPDDQEVVFKFLMVALLGDGAVASRHGDDHVFPQLRGLDLGLAVTSRGILDLGGASWHVLQAGLCANVHTLRISHASLNDTALHRIGTRMTRLTSLALVAPAAATLFRTSIESLFSPSFRQRIERFELDGSIMLTHEILRSAMGPSCPRLSSVRLANIAGLGATSLEVFSPARCPSLTALDISRCDGLGTDTLDVWLGQAGPGRLRSLSLSSTFFPVARQSDVLARQLSPSLTELSLRSIVFGKATWLSLIRTVGPHLRRLAVVSAYIGFDDDVLVAVAEHGTSLTSLTFGDNVSVSAGGIAAFVDRTTAPIEECSIVDFSTVFPLPPFMPDNVAFAVIDKFGPRLRKLHLSPCRLDAKVREYVVALQLPQLEDLNIGVYDPSDKM